MQTVDSATGEIELWSDADECALTEAESRVVRGLTESWIALKEINEQRLYRKHGTWDTYCMKRWGFTGGRGYQIVDAAYAALEVSEAGIVFPNERVARAYLAIEPEKRLSVVLAAKSAFGDRLTGGIISSASKVIDEAIQTRGYIDTGNGSMTALDAAIVGEEHERVQRQRQHLADAASRANGTTHDQRVSLGTFVVHSKRESEGSHYVTLRVSVEVLAQVKEGQIGGGVLFLKPEVKPE